MIKSVKLDKSFNTLGYNEFIIDIRFHIILF